MAMHLTTTLQNNLGKPLYQPTEENEDEMVFDTSVGSNVKKAHKKQKSIQKSFEKKSGLEEISEQSKDKEISIVNKDGYQINLHSRD